MTENFRSYFRAGILAVIVGFVGTGAFGQDFDKGADAYDRGDFQAALKEWHPLAEQGDALAQSELGSMYDHGEGVLQDYAEAVRWYRLAAEQGHANAQKNLGNMYDTGEGVPEDDTEAARWWRLAADQGNADAQSTLGIAYALGSGVPKEYISAHMWLNIAGANGNKGARMLRDEFEKTMTPADISEAQRRARICMSSGYQNCVTVRSPHSDAVDLDSAAQLRAREAFRFGFPCMSLGYQDCD